MKRIFFTVVSLSVAAVCLAQIAEPKCAMAATKQPPAVVILQCNSFGGVQPPTVVTAVDGTINSPSINTGGSCAAALLQLVSAGFTLEGVVFANPFGPNGQTLVYTMVRTT
jgi:hypothetical protein